MLAPHIATVGLSSRYIDMPNPVADWLKRLRQHQWTLVSSMAASAFVLGIVGLYRLQAEAGSLDRWSWGDAIYFSIRLFGFNYDLGGDGHAPYGGGNWQLRLACFLAPASTALAVYKAAMLAAADIIARFRVSLWNGHAVICGAGERGRQLAMSLRDENRQVVVIEKNRDSDTLSDIRKAGAQVVIGSVTDPATQAAAGLDRASTVVALTPCYESNLQVVLAVSQVAEQRKPKGFWRISERKPVQAFAYAPRAFMAMFEGQKPFDAIKNGVECGFFDDNASAARQLVTEYLPKLAATLFQECRPARILVAGDGEVIPELVGVLVTQSHFGGSQVPRVQVLTVDEDELARGFPLRHPQMPLVADLRVSPMSMARMARVELDSLGRDTDRSSFDLIFVACRQDADTLILSTNLAQQVAAGIHVVACLAPSTRLTGLFKQPQPIAGVTIKNLVTVGCGANDVLRNRLDRTAMEIHEAFYTQQLASGRKEGDTLALHPWAGLRGDFRQANRSQADHRAIKEAILAVSRTDDTLELLAEAEHLRWTADRIFSGWRHAAVRDDEKRLHPSICSYRDLSEEDKNKDREAVKSTLAGLSGN